MHLSPAQTDAGARAAFDHYPAPPSYVDAMTYDRLSPLAREAYERVVRLAAEHAPDFHTAGLALFKAESSWPLSVRGRWPNEIAHRVEVCAVALKAALDV